MYVNVESVQTGWSAECGAIEYNSETWVFYEGLLKVREIGSGVRRS